MNAQQRSTTTRLVVLVDTAITAQNKPKTHSSQQASPWEFRRQFAQAVREAIMHAALTDRLDLAHAEECWRAAPDPESV